MARRPPDIKTVIVYLVIGLLLVAAANVLLGGAGLFRVLRLLVIYGAVFLLLIFVLNRARRRR